VVEAPCVVLSSEVMRHPAKRPTRSAWRSATAIRIGGSTYGASRYDFEPRPSIGRKAKKRIVARFPAGLETTCRVNPDVPSEAVIDRGLGAWAAFARRGGNFRGRWRDLCDLARRGTGVV